jgi:hypothetical protein
LNPRSVFLETGRNLKNPVVADGRQLRKLRKLIQEIGAIRGERSRLAEEASF